MKPVDLFCVNLLFTTINRETLQEKQDTTRTAFSLWKISVTVFTLAINTILFFERF